MPNKKTERNTEEPSISQQIANLKQSLSSHVSPIGDWKIIKQLEYTAAGLPAPYSEKEMQEYHEQRIAVREEINMLEAELDAKLNG